MHLTKASNYALRALVVLGEGDGRTRHDLKTLAAKLGAPPAFLGKVMQGLARAGLVEGVRGAHGGFALARPASQIDIRSVVEATEGRTHLSRCSTDGSCCERKLDCGPGKFWRKLNDSINEILESETVASLAAANGSAPNRRG